MSNFSDHLHKHDFPGLKPGSSILILPVAGYILQRVKNKKKKPSHNTEINRFSHENI